MKKKKTIKIKNVVLEIPVAVMLIILTLLVLVPVIWMVFSAFKPERNYFVAAYIYTEFIYFGKLYRCTGPY